MFIYILVFIKYLLIDMNSTLKMNNFLQRMLKKSDEEIENEKVIIDSTSLQVEYSPRGKKRDWIKKLGAYSPSKRDASPCIGSPLRPNTPKPTGHRNDYRRRSVPEPVTPKNSSFNPKMPNLEDIIQEFEIGYLSPTKQETKETTKAGCFVKKIVAAFEEKYKPYNDTKMSGEKPTRDDENQDNTLDGSKTPRELSRTYVIDSLESRLSLSNYLDSFDSSSVSYSRESPDCIDLSKCSFAMDEELIVSTPAKNSSELSKLRESSIILDETLKESVTNNNNNNNNNNNDVKPSKTLVRSNSSMRRERQPKIIGAFLKKPIEVEDTAIDWIPITGKKLPRKKSFKRLLSVLTGKNKSSGKSSKLYCSQINLQEETSKELHDSGYDEKSCSSSSLTSLVSITDLLLQQDNYEIEANRRTGTLSTFKKSHSNIDHEIDCPDDLLLVDDFSDTCSVNSKKLFLEELPRSECRLSLGPVFPPKYGAKSLDQREQTFDDNKLEQNEDSFDEISSSLSWPLPKHPFVSAKNESVQCEESFSNGKTCNTISFQEFDAIELRRNRQSWKFTSSEVTYDTPRTYLSKSEPGLYRQPKFTFPSDEIVYDVPKLKIPQRPKSSVYDDALSLKRRNNDFSSSPPASGFYAFPSQEEPHYATVKPRNSRINPSRELLRSVGDLTNANYYARVFDQIRDL